MQSIELLLPRVSHCHHSFSRADYTSFFSPTAVNKLMSAVASRPCVGILHRRLGTPPRAFQIRPTLLTSEPESLTLSAEIDKNPPEAIAARLGSIRGSATGYIQYFCRHHGLEAYCRTPSCISKAPPPCVAGATLLKRCSGDLGCSYCVHQARC